MTPCIDLYRHAHKTANILWDWIPISDRFGSIIKEALAIELEAKNQLGQFIMVMFE